MLSDSLQIKTPFVSRDRGFAGNILKNIFQLFVTRCYNDTFQ